MNIYYTLKRGDISKEIENPIIECIFIHPDAFPEFILDTNNLPSCKDVNIYYENLSNEEYLYSNDDDNNFYDMSLGNIYRGYYVIEFNLDKPSIICIVNEGKEIMRIKL